MKRFGFIQIKTILKFATACIFLCHSVNSRKCSNNYPVIEVSSELNTLEADNYPVNYYTVAPQAKSFTINCSSTDPVIWDIYSQSATGNVKVSFHYETIRFETNKTGTVQVHEKDCHTVSLELFNVSEDATGLYKCKNINDGFWYEGFPQVFIYGGSNDSTGNLLNRGQLVTLSTEDYEREFTDDFLMTIPCELNYPGNRTVDIFIEKTTETFSSVEGRHNNSKLSGPPKSELRKIDRPLYDLYTNVPTSNCYLSDVYICVDFRRLKSKFRASEQLRKGMKVTCKTDKEERGDLVQIDVKRTPVISQVPYERSMTLYVDYNEPVTFTCKSTKSIKMTTNWNHTQILKSQYTPKSKKALNERNSRSSSFWTYQEELTITTPASEHYQFEEELDWQSFEVQVTCTTKDSNENVSWNYKLINIHGNRYESKEKRNRIVELINGDLGCYSKAPSTMSAKFVPCATFNECQLKSKFLFYPKSDNIYTVTNTSINRNLFQFAIPKVTSGLVRCHGYGIDSVAIAYVKLGHYRKRPFKLRGLLNEKKESPSFGVLNHFVVSSETEVFEGDIVSVSCSTPLMLTVSYPLLEFKFRNETQSIVGEEFIKSKLEATEGEIFFVAAEVQIPTSEITGISCVNRQYTSFTPMAWSEGVLSLPAETTTEFKRNSVLLKVNARR